MNSRDKGARREREARDMAREYWRAHDCVRTAQVSGKFSSDLLNALPGCHIEVKGHHKIGAVRFMDQAFDDMKPGEVPVVVMKEDRGAWLVMFPMALTAKFVKAFLKNYGSVDE